MIVFIYEGTAVDVLQNTVSYVAVIGDAERVSAITTAVYRGYHAAFSSE